MISPRIFSVFGTATILLASACSGAPETSSSEQAGEEDQALSATSFRSAGPFQTVTINGSHARFAPASARVMASMKAMTSANDIQPNQFWAGSYSRLPAAFIASLKNAPGSPATRAGVFDLLFRIDGSTPGDANVFGGYTAFNTALEEVFCTPTTASAALATYRDFSGYKNSSGDTQVTAEKRAIIVKGATASVSALVHTNPSAKFMACTWDNHDDTVMEGLFALDVAHATLDAVISFEGP